MENQNHRYRRAAFSAVAASLCLASSQALALGPDLPSISDDIGPVVLTGEPWQERVERCEQTGRWDFGRYFPSVPNPEDPYGPPLQRGYCYPSAPPSVILHGIDRTNNVCWAIICTQKSVSWIDHPAPVYDDFSIREYGDSLANEFRLSSFRL